MKIKTRLRLSIILSLILTVTVGLFVLFALQKMNAEIEKERTATEIVKGMAELKIVALEYLLHPTDRSLMQWKSTYDYLTKRLVKKANGFESPAEKIALDKILKNITRFKDAFNNVTTSFGKEQGLVRQESAISPDLRDRLISDLLVKSQATVSPVFQLQQMIQTELMAAQQKSGLLIVIFILILAFFVTAISLWINRSIARPIAELEKDIRIIGNGNLDHKVGTTAKDEIGHLSRSFDMMTGDLKKTTASIVDLNKEIDERKQAEEALKESEARYKSLVELSPEAVFVHQEGIIVYINSVGTGIFGATDHEEIIGKPALDFIHPDYHEIAKRRNKQTRKGKGTLSPVEYKIIGFDNKEIDVMATTTYIDYLGKPSILSVIRDITDQKLAQTALRESEEKFRLLSEQNLLGVIIIQDGLVKYVNKAACEMTEYSIEEVLDWKPNEFGKLFHPDDLDFVIEQAQKKQEGAEDVVTQYSYRMLTKSGKVKWVDVYSKTIIFGGKTADLITIIDITERKQAEEILRYFQKAIDSASDAIGMSTPDGRHYYQNKVFTELFGLTIKETDGEQGPSSTVYANEKTGREVFKTIMEGGSWTGEVKMLDKNRKEIDVFLRAYSIKDKKDNVVGLVGVHTDITSRKQAEKAMLESELRYRTLFENNEFLIFITDNKGVILLANDKAASCFEQSNETIIGKSFSELRPDRTEMYQDVIDKILSTGETLQFETLYPTPKEDKWLFVTVSPLKIDNDTKLQVITQDITDRKRTEEALRESEEKLARSQKMEAMGLMAGGVAHDLNNILSGIVSYPELLLMNLPEDSPMRKPIKTIQESGMRAADVVEDLITIARGVASSKEVLNLNTVLEEHLKSVEHQESERTHSFVNFKTEFDPDLLNMSGSPTHIKKILMNLVNNGSEAIEGSGTVTISTANQYLDEPLKGYESVRTGEYVKLSVSDDGSGISPEDIERIFEPFYTKKVMGKSGTGLGLAVVWNTVQDHNGYINVNSSGEGTTFELYFLVTREELAAEEEDVPLKDFLGHGEKILIVDDEERQREIASGMLTELGYHVETVSSGEEAIEYVKTNPIDLIVLDMVMPKGINGRKTYEEIIKIRPGQKAVIASGYAKSKEVDIAQGLGAGKYIKKPYILAKIGVAVKEELEKQAVFLV